MHLQANADESVPDVRLPRLLQHVLVHHLLVALFAEDHHARLLVNILLINLVGVLHVTRRVLRIVLLLFVQLVEIVLGSKGLKHFLVIVILRAPTPWNLRRPVRQRHSLFLRY